MLREQVGKIEAFATGQGIKVLVADDDLPTRMLLRAAIQQWGYTVVEAPDGEEAWKILNKEDAPLLLVVDWLMPKLDGVALCQRIKEKLQNNPYIILLTQVTGTSNIIKALEAGADEFLTKPFNMAELRSRLAVGAKIIGYKNILAEQNDQLQDFVSKMESLAEERAQELIQNTDFIMILGKLLSQISHEISEALNLIDFNGHKEKLEKQDHILTVEAKQKIYELHNNLKQVVDLIQSLQKHSIKYAGKPAICQINDTIQNAIDICQIALQKTQIEYALAKELPPIFVDRDQLQQAIVGLVLNTCEILKTQSTGILKIETSYLKNKNVILMQMECSGPKIHAKDLGSILQPYWGFEPNAKNTNPMKMSVTMSRDILQKLHGTLRIETREEGGIRFIVDLPGT